MSVRNSASKNGFWLLLAGTLTAVGASACCVIPLILLSLGIGGSWLSSLSLLEPYRPLFIGATLLLLIVAFHRIYLAPRVCDSGSSCAQPNAIKRSRLAFWVALALSFGLIALPWLMPLFTHPK
jgi:mercuric ion transport protein